MKKAFIILCTLIVTGCSAKQFINHNPLTAGKTTAF